MLVLVEKERKECIISTIVDYVAKNKGKSTYFCRWRNGKMNFKYDGEELNFSDIYDRDDVKYSYECSELIEEILRDIEYYSRMKRCYLYYIYINGRKVYVDYALDEDIEDDEVFDTLDEEAIETSTLEKALEILREQNRII